MSKAMRIACVLVVLGSFGVFTDKLLWAGAVLTWQDCLLEASKNNPALASSRESLNQVKADQAALRATSLPQLTTSAGGQTSKVSGRAKTDNYSYSVSGRQLLFDGFKTSNDLAAVREKISSAEYSYLVVSSNVRLDLWTSFIGLLSAQESLWVTKNILSRRQQNEDLVALQYKGGREHKGSLLTAQANTAQARIEYVQARRNVDLAQIRLSAAMGRDTFCPVTVSGSLDIQGIDRSRPDFEALVTSTPLLKQISAKKEAARFAVKSARSDFFPQVFLDAGAGKSDKTWLPRTSEWSTGVSVTFPLFQGGQQQAALAKTRAALHQAVADERSGRDSVMLTLAEAWTQWQNDVDQALVQQKFLEASAERAGIVEAQYTSGLATFNDWSIIEDDLVRDQKALLQAKTNALIAQSAWQQAKGETLDD